MKLIKILIYFGFFKKYFYINKYNFYFKNNLKFFNDYISCLNCHNNFNIPIIKNQNKNYFKNIFINYKLFLRKSFYMNYIFKNLKNFNFKKFLIFFNE